MILLSDGRVMVQEEATPHWHALTPDSQCSYLHGTWAPLADMSIWRRYYASGMLRDGRVIVIGGEQSGAGGDTNKGEIYDPVSDTWSAIPPPPGWAKVGDASCCILPDGRLMIGALTTPQCVIFDPVSDSWSPATSKAIRSNEETWVLLGDDSIITAQCFPPFRSERYSISSDAWKDEGPIPVSIVDPLMNEIGPAMLMYNGKVIYFGAADSGGHGKTAIYTPPPVYTGTGTWAAGPDIPNIGGSTIVCNDCPASLLPNGKVLVACAPYTPGTWGSPIYFLEYDPFNNVIAQAPTPPNNTAQLYWSRFMLLPTGQVLFSPGTSNVQCYTPDGNPQDAWRPVILTIARHGHAHSSDYVLTGLQLNGLSQANMYGDDCNPATNYPLVQLRNPHIGRVYFARAYDFSARAVATGGLQQSVRFSVAHVPYGRYELCVIANGISSRYTGFDHHRRHKSGDCHPCCAGEADCDCGKYKESECREHDAMSDPELIALRNELGQLKRSIHRLNSFIPVPEPHREPKEAKEAHVADAESRAARRGSRPAKIG